MLLPFPCRLSLELAAAVLCIASPAPEGEPRAIAQEPRLPDGTPAAPLVLAGIPDETGWDELFARLDGAVPTGALEEVAMAEASSGGNYAPDLGHPEFAGKLLTLKSGASGTSGHATTVGQHFYGLATSIAPGVADVSCYSATHFLASGFLRNVVLINAPHQVSWRVQNNSWIGGGDDTYLRKYDFAIEDQDILAVSGVNNGTGPLDVPLFSHLYNGIAVGRSDGNHHAGGTLNGYGTKGRQKPELVAPASATSFATPLVAGAGALLRETARTHQLLAMNPDALEPEVLKAALMAGAEHRAGWANDAPQTGAARGLATLPLDPLFGADELDVNRAHWILTGGEQPWAASAAAAADTRHNGWSVAPLGESESACWRFQVEAEKPYVSVLATWNRHVDPGFVQWTEPEIDMELWSVAGGGALVSMVGDPGLGLFASGNVKSASTKDNLEHLYATELAPGEYVLEVTRAADGQGEVFDVAVAWELACAPPFTYGTGKLTSSGLTPSLAVRGIPSAAEDDLDLRVHDAEPGKSGVFFWGVGQKAAPFHGGTLWVQGPLKRTPLVTTDATGSATLPIPIDPSMIGTQRNYQFWFRDPAHPDGTSVGLSDAAQIVFCP